MTDTAPHGSDTKRTVWGRLNTWPPGYFVSDAGEVRTVDRVDTAGNRRLGQLLKPRPAGSGGHLQVVMSVGGRRVPEYLHRMVGAVFLDNPDPERYRLVRHKDDVAIHNDADNLEFGDHKLNAADRRRNRNKKETA